MNDKLIRNLRSSQLSQTMIWMQYFHHFDGNNIQVLRIRQPDNPTQTKDSHSCRKGKLQETYLKAILQVRKS